MLAVMDEVRRLEVLRRYNILDTPPDAMFDRIAFLAAHHFRAPMAVVSFVDDYRQWFKAVYGLDVRETPREISFCQYTIQQKQVMVVSDATKDPRLRDTPLVCSEPHLRFYAGAPLLTARGECLGTVAVLDNAPRPDLDPGDRIFLESLAEIVIHELEIRLAAADVAADIERRRQSEQRLELVLAHAPITLASQDKELRYTWVVNPPPPWTADSFLGKSDGDLWPGALGRSLLAMKRDVMADRTRRRVDVNLPIAGRMRDFDMTLEPIIEDGEVAGLSCAAVDVTERKHAERALAATEARHRAVLQTAVDAIVVTDEFGIIQHFNRAASRIFGYREEEVRGRNVSLLMPEPDRSAHDDYIRGYLETGEAKIMGVGREVEGLRRDGSLVPLDLQISEWREDSMRMFTATMRDISKRRAREEALHRAEDERAQTLVLLNTMIESIPDVFFCKDLDGRYVVANSPTARVMGRDDVVGRTDFDLLPAAQAERLREVDQQVMESGLPLVAEEEMLDHQRGQVRWFMTMKTPLRDPSGAIIGVVGLGRDITERRQMVDELKDARDQAEAANRAKSTFLAAASHDLRQPVQALSLFTSTLQSRLADHPAAEVVNRMQQSLEALQGLLEALLDISRLDAGVVEVHRERVSISRVVGRVVEDYRGLAAEKRLRFRHVPCRHWVETDPKLLERVVRNLLDNALKYTHAGGILVGCRFSGDHLRLQIVDTGIGIPPEQVETVFQEFVQLHNAGRDRTKGLGLGLSIVRRLLALLGHRLEVSSRPGGGSTFTILLPRVVPEGEDRQLPGAIPDGPLGTKQVLVIEDEEMVRQGMQMLVGGWGCDVLTAADQDEAIAVALRQRIPDLIIADYRLQGGRLGTDAVKAVHQACGRTIPAMIVTGDTAPERIVEAKASGFALAHKPVAPERLRAFIERGR